jgi:hypothetical protein
MNSLRIGRGCLVVGLALIVLALVILGYLFTRPPVEWRRSSRLGCVNNLKQIGLAIRTWAIDNDDQFPFNVSTNTGGTMELCAVGSDGFDTNAALHFQVMSNELSTPRILVCPEDWSTKPARWFPDLRATNVTYRLHSGTNLNESNPTAVLVVCPFDGNTLLCDARVTGMEAGWKPPKRAFMEVVRHEHVKWLARVWPLALLIRVVLLWAGSRVTWKAKGGPKPKGLLLGELFLVLVALLFIWGMLFPLARR